jgi:hypothetical protein
MAAKAKTAPVAKPAKAKAAKAVLKTTKAAPKVATKAAAISKPVVSAPVPAPVKAVSAPKPKTAPVVEKAAIQKEKTMTDTVKTMEDTIKTAAADASEKATAMFGDMQGRAKAAFEKSGDMMKDVVEFHKANLEAMVESGKIAAKGSQTAFQNATEYGRKNWEATTGFAKSVSTIKSPTDFFKLQGDFARSQFDSAVAEFSKSSEFTMKMMGEVAQPIQNRAAAVAEQMKARMAA